MLKYLVPYSLLLHKCIYKHVNTYVPTHLYPEHITLSIFLAEVASEWTEETVSLCLGLFVALLPINHKLLKE